MKKSWNKTQSISLLVVGLLLAGCSVLPGNTEVEPTATSELVIESNEVVAEGRIVPRDSARLSFQLAGEVAEVLVQKGDLVAQGDVIVRLKADEQLQAGLQAAQLELLIAQQDYTRLQDAASLTTAQADAAVTQAEIDLQDAQQALADLDTDDYQQEIDDAIEAVNTADEDLVDAQEELDKVKDLDEDNTTRKNAEQDLEDAQREYDQAVRDRDLLILRLDQARQAVPLAEARLEDARRQAESLQEGIDPDDLALAQQRTQAAETSVAAAEAALARLELKAPFTGTIVDLDLAAGELVAPNQPIAQVADLSQWYIETTDLTENEVVRIAPSQEVIITPDAIPDLALDGVVELIGDSYLEKSGDITYVIRILLDESDPRLKWGMTVEVKFKE